MMQPASAPKISSWKKAERSFLLVFGLGFLLYLAFFSIEGAIELHRTADRRGWVTHDHDTPVWISGDWMVGEYRDCGMQTTTPPTGVVLSQEAMAELPRLFCGKDWEGKGILEFQLSMPDYNVATNAIWHGGDWAALEGNFHVLPVRYNGRIDRPNEVFISWRCQRNNNSFLNSKNALTCNALN